MSTTSFSAKEEFNKAFQECISEEVDRWGNPLNTWRASGKRSKAYPDKEDKSYWDKEGPIHVQRWIDWREQNYNQHPLWVTPDGELGVELNLTVYFGKVKVKAIIDRVINVNGYLAVVDLKSGSKSPSSLLQLGVYASAIQIKYGVRPSLGAYFSTRKGESLGFESLDHLSIPRLTFLFETFVENARKGKYLPMPGDHCSWCDVRKACALLNGRDAGMHDTLSLM